MIEAAWHIKILYVLGILVGVPAAIVTILFVGFLAAHIALASVALTCGLFMWVLKKLGWGDD